MPQADPHVTEPRPRRRRRHPGAVMVCLLACGAIGIGDRVMRSRQNLVARLLTHDVPLILPFSDYLQDHAEKKTTWNHLHERMSTAAAAGDKPALAKAGYELAKFIDSEISADDRRRR